MHIDTFLTHQGRSSARAAQAVNPPLVRASTVVFASLADYKHAHHVTVFDGAKYGRSGTSTTFELQRSMAALCGVSACIATGSGLSAIVAVLCAYAGVGKHVLVYEGVYGPTRTFCDNELRAMGTDVEFFAAQTDVSTLLRANTSLVFIETPASLTMEMLDVRAVCAAAHSRNVTVAADSTWGTPLFFDAHGLGIDISVHSGTKFISGHSDLMLGLITGSDTNMHAVRKACDHHGAHAAPDVCWLALRGLRTLSLRMQRHQQTAMAVALWLQAQPQVQRVLYPALPNDPGHALWRAQFSGAAGPLTFELTPCSEPVFAAFIDALQLFSLGTSWGGFESLVLPAVPYHLRHLDVLPDAGRLVRVHLGLEHAQDLCDDLGQALSAIGTQMLHI